MAEEHNPRILQLETSMFVFDRAIDVDSYLALAMSHRENLDIDLAAASTNRDFDLCRTLLEKDKTVLTNIVRLQRQKDSRIFFLERDMKTLPKTLDDVNAHLETAVSHQHGLATDLAAAQHMHYQDLCALMEKADKALQSNISKLRHLKGKLNKSVGKQAKGNKQVSVPQTEGESSKCRRTDTPQPPGDINPHTSTHPGGTEQLPDSSSLHGANTAPSFGDTDTPSTFDYANAAPSFGDTNDTPLDVRPVDTDLNLKGPEPTYSLNTNLNGAKQPELKDSNEDRMDVDSSTKPKAKSDSEHKTKKAPAPNHKPPQRTQPNGQAPNRAFLDNLMAMASQKDDDRGDKSEGNIDDEDEDEEKERKGKAKVKGKEKKKGKGKKKVKVDDDPKPGHCPGEWGNLSLIVQNNIRKDAEDDLEQHIAYNLPFSHQSRSWSRRAQVIGAQAAIRSKRLAASLFIAANRRTVCHFHTTNDKGGLINDIAADSDDKFRVTGVPFERQGEEKKIRDPVYLTRAFGHDRPPKPTSRNQNFTLERVLKFFPMVDGIHTMHCGCTLNEALIDFYFWKRIVLYLESLKISKPYTRPMKPRNCLFLVSALKWMEFDFDVLYSFDEDGYRQTTADRFEKYAHRLLDVAEEMRGEKKKKTKDDQGKGKGKGKKKLEYVEIPDVDSTEHRKKKREGSEKKVKCKQAKEGRSVDRGVQLRELDGADSDAGPIVCYTCTIRTSLAEESR